MKNHLNLPNFASFATPILSLKDMGNYTPKSDLETGVPIVPFYTVQTTIKIPKICVSDLIKLLEKTLSGIKKIYTEKKEYFIYKIEYFPIEELRINPFTKPFYKKKYLNSLYATEKALKMFPHNLNDLNYYDNPDSIFISDWFKAEIRLYYDNKNDHYLLEINRLKGERRTFYCCFYNYIKEVFNEKNLLWLMRKNYINLLEGIGRTQDHICHYLLDELICKEICSFQSCKNL